MKSATDWTKLEEWEVALLKDARDMQTLCKEGYILRGLTRFESDVIDIMRFGDDEVAQIRTFLAALEAKRHLCDSGTTT